MTPKYNIGDTVYAILTYEDSISIRKIIIEHINSFSADGKYYITYDGFDEHCMFYAIEDCIEYMHDKLQTLHCQAIENDSNNIELSEWNIATIDL